MRKIPVPMQRESEREKRKEEKNVTKRKKEIKRGEGGGHPCPRRFTIKDINKLYSITVLRST